MGWPFTSATTSPPAARTHGSTSTADAARTRTTAPRSQLFRWRNQSIIRSNPSSLGRLSHCTPRPVLPGPGGESFRHFPTPRGGAGSPPRPFLALVEEGPPGGRRRVKRRTEKRVRPDGTTDQVLPR